MKGGSCIISPLGKVLASAGNKKRAIIYSEINLDEIDYVINCSSTFEYVNHKYDIKYDYDYQISKKLQFSRHILRK